jgi:multidrug efflux pump subunit AcrB
MQDNTTNSLLTRIVKLFLTTRLSIILIILSLALGAAALFTMPKEEDPQIIVPMADVTVVAPGIGTKEINNLVAHPLENLLWQIKGVEDVYTTSKDGRVLVTVRFFVGTNQDTALIRLRNQIQMHKDEIPSIVKNWVVKPISINDVPIVTAVLYSDKYNDYQLHRIGEEVLTHLDQLPNISSTKLIGGRERVVRIQFIPSQLAAHNVTPLEVYQAVKNSNVSLQVGKIDTNNQQFIIKTHSLIRTKKNLGDVVISTHAGKPVFLHDVASINDGPSDIENYTSIGFSKSYQEKHHLTSSSFPAVTLALAKKGGANAVTVGKEIVSKIQSLQKTVIPAGVKIHFIRNYGKTAHDKVTNLIYSLTLAILTVVIILILSLGWREAIIVATSVPISFSLALFVDYLFGYSINRVTLFALILSLGLVVDDPITNIENIRRHISNGKEKLGQAILSAVNEVLPPVIMASLAIIVSFIPLFFITGMMGPYMSPMAATVPLTIIFSTVASLTIVPWMAYKLLKPHKTHLVNHDEKNAHKNKLPLKKSLVKKTYHRIITPFLLSRKKRYSLLIGVVLLLAGCVSIVLVGGVPLKLLPFDNKDSLQLVIKLPEGSTLEQTNRVVQDFEYELHQSKYVTSYSSYVGVPSAMDFNSLVRHYYLRHSDNLADIRVKLIDKEKRHLQSHEIGLLLRHSLEKIAKRDRAKLSIVEMPPGPPVMQTLVAEVKGSPGTSYNTLISAAKKVEAMLKKEPLVVDTDSSTQSFRSDYAFIIDKEKSSLNGITVQQINQTLNLSLGKKSPLLFNNSDERTPIPIVFESPRNQRSDMEALSGLAVRGNHGKLVQLISLGQFKKVPHSQPILLKNLRSIVYVTANTAGRPPANVVLNMEGRIKSLNLPPGIKVDWSGEGSWKITVRVFRDMGIGFAAALLAIYILLFIQTNSFIMPLIMMISIPLTVIGIIPGFWLLNLITNHPINGFPTPIFFTATSMIGMIALGGIVIRNSVILVDFIEKSIAKGLSLKEAVIESGVVRFRPIVLTALTAALGAWPITLDPIFSGLAWALIFGLFASTAFTLIIIPVTYYAFSYKTTNNRSMSEL